MTTNIFPHLRAAAALACALLASACALTPTDAQWTEADAAVKENKVLFLQETYDVRFAPGSDELSAEERNRLAAFLAREDIGRYDEISLAVAGDTSGKDGTLGDRRRAAVTAFLKGRHLKAAPDQTSGAPIDRVTMIVGRYIVVPPHCPDWRKPSNQDPQNTPSSNLGCATVTNLGLMVSDPRDLVAGKEPTGSDADHNDYAIQRYRQGYYKVPNNAYEKSPNDFAKGTGVPEKKGQQ